MVLEPRRITVDGIPPFYTAACFVRTGTVPCAADMFGMSQNRAGHNDTQAGPGFYSLQFSFMGK